MASRGFHFFGAFCWRMAPLATERILAFWQEEAFAHGRALNPAVAIIELKLAQG
jgi:hypothetical protein